MRRICHGHVRKMNHVLIGAGAVVFSAVRWIGIARCCKAKQVCVADLNVR